MGLATCPPSLAGRNGRFHGDPVRAGGENHGSRAEFSAAAIVVEVRRRQPALQPLRGGTDSRFYLASGLLSRAMEAALIAARSGISHRMQALAET